MSELQNSNLATERSLETMKNLAQKYAERSHPYFYVDPSITAVTIEEPAKQKDDFSSPLCPFRHYEDKEAEVKVAYWNCSCVPVQERQGCHCMFFLTRGNT